MLGGAGFLPSTLVLQIPKKLYKIPQKPSNMTFLGIWSPKSACTKPLRVNTSGRSSGLVLFTPGHPPAASETYLASLVALEKRMSRGSKCIPPSETRQKNQARYVVAMFLKELSSERTLLVMVCRRGNVRKKLGYIFIPEICVHESKQQCTVVRPKNKPDLIDFLLLLGPGAIEKDHTRITYSYTDNHVKGFQKLSKSY